MHRLWNASRIQRNDSLMCRCFCIAFIQFMFSNKSGAPSIFSNKSGAPRLLKFITIFSQSDFQKRMRNKFIKTLTNIFFLTIIDKIFNKATYKLRKFFWIYLTHFPINLKNWQRWRNRKPWLYEEFSIRKERTKK